MVLFECARFLEITDPTERACETDETSQYAIAQNNPPSPSPSSPATAAPIATSAKNGVLISRPVAWIDDQIRIYVVTPPDLPLEFIDEDLTTYRDITNADQYMVHIELYQRLLESSHRTRNVTEADIVFAAHSHFRPVEEFIEWTRAQPTYGRVPHLVMYTHVFQDALWQLADPALMATTEPRPGVPYRHNWDMIIPYGATAHQANWLDRERVVNGTRSRTMYFRGRSVGPRPPFIEHFRSLAPNYTIEVVQDELQHTKDEYVVGLLTHVFCLAGAGDVQSSKRTYEVVMAGCIPVLITLGGSFQGVHLLAFEARVDWESFAVFVSPDTSPVELQRRLESMSADEIRRRQLAMNRYWRAFYIETNHTLANSPAHDAVDMLDYIISTLADRLPELRRRRNIRVKRRSLY